MLYKHRREMRICLALQNVLQQKKYKTCKRGAETGGEIGVTHGGPIGELKINEGRGRGGIEQRQQKPKGAMTTRNKQRGVNIGVMNGRVEWRG